MDTITGLGLAVAADVVKKSFLRVFEGSSTGAEGWFQRIKLRTYVRDRYADYVLRTVGVFPLFGTTKQANVESAYVQVAVAPDIARLRYRPYEVIEEGVLREARGTVDSSRAASGVDLFDVIDQSSQSIALIGGPGSGKTTILRSVAVAAAKGRPVRGRHVLPVFLPARDMAARRPQPTPEDERANKGTKDHEDRPTYDIRDSVAGLLLSFGIEESERVVKHLLEAGDLMILLDGIDEVGLDYQTQLLEELRDIVNMYPKAIVCVSSRPQSLEVALPHFDQWETLPLLLADRIALVRKWFDAIDPAKGERMISECAENPSLLDLGSNPLLLCIVCALYYNDLRIPNEPDELYSRTLDGMLGGWDAFRSIARDTVLHDLSVKRRVVLSSWIAAAMFGLERIVFKVHEVEHTGVIAKFARQIHRPELSAEAVIRSLYNDFGVLVERAPGAFSFAHLTLQEYLTAQYLVDNRRENEFIPVASSERWFEVFRLMAKLLPNANDFMTQLTLHTNIASRHEVSLLRAAWDMHPIVDSETALHALATLAARITDEMSSLSERISVMNSGAELRLSTKKGHAETRDIATFSNLPELLEILKSQGAGSSQLGLKPGQLLTQVFDANVSPRMVIVERRF